MEQKTKNTAEVLREQLDSDHVIVVAFFRGEKGLRIELNMSGAQTPEEVTAENIAAVPTFEEFSAALPNILTFIRDHLPTTKEKQRLVEEKSA
jgi:hypothetical protein